MAGAPGGEAESFTALLAELRACRRCAPRLPVPPRPVFQLHPTARILLISQAPGRAAQRSGRVFDDASGERLRAWLGVDRATFYDPTCFAVLPMGLCWPGRSRAGDAPPPPECASLWHPRILPRLRALRLRLYVGRFAVERYLVPHFGRRLSDVLARWRELPPGVLALPHPSPRNRWPDRHRWYAAELLPELRRQVAAALADG